MNSKGSPCKYYLGGGCHRGDSCNYSHQKAATICKYFLKGTCIYGNKCSLLHKGVPLKPGSSGGDNKEPDSSLRSNEFSDREKESDGSNVEWDRNTGDQRGTESDCEDDGALDDQQSEDDRNNEKLKAGCHFFNYFGSCSNGDNCGFAHSTPNSGNGARESGISNQFTPEYILKGPCACRQ